MTRVVVAGFAFAAIVIVALGTVLTPARAGPGLSILHIPPSAPVVGAQIPLVATLWNATAAIVEWRNATMTSDQLMPMTNLSRPDGDGWVFSAWLPAQDSPTSIRYALNASNGQEYRAERYQVAVELPSGSGLRPEQEQAWVLTFVAWVSMIGSAVAMMYWYTGRRLRQEGA